jgi:hypothetical protein
MGAFLDRKEVTGMRDENRNAAEELACILSPESGR